MLSILLIAGVIIGAIFAVVAVVYLFILIINQLSKQTNNPVILIASRFLTGGPNMGLLPVSLQNLISMTGVALGVWAMMLMMSVIGGFERDLRSKIVLNTPHVQIRTKSIFSSFDSVEKIKRKISKIKGIKKISPQFVGRAMVVSYTNAAMSIELRGIPHNGPTWKILKREIVGGDIKSLIHPELLSKDRDLTFKHKKSNNDSDILGPVVVGQKSTISPALLLGTELASNLGVDIGDEVQIIVPDAAIGPTGLVPRVRHFLVGGLVKTGLYKFDLNTVYMSVKEAEKSFGQMGPNTIGIWGQNPEDSYSLIKELRNRFKNSKKLDIIGVYEEFFGLFSSLKLERLAIFVVLTLIILVAAFSIFGALVMIGLERLPVIAALSALGMPKSSLREIFIGMGSIIGVVGVVAGGLLGFLTIFVIKWVGIPMPSQYYIRHVPVQMNVLEFMLIWVITIGICVLSSLYPAAIALKGTVAEGLRNE